MQGVNTCLDLVFQAFVAVLLTFCQVNATVWFANRYLAFKSVVELIREEIVCVSLIKTYL